jgi:hypothetical protein
MFGTMLHLKNIGYLKALKVITVFSVGAGISKMPTSILKPFFDGIRFEAIDLNLKMIMRPGNAEERKLLSAHTMDLFTEFALANKLMPDKLADIIRSCSEGLVIAPMGFRHPDHNFLSRLGVAQYFYREYPYYWNRSESYDKRLYEYNVLRLESRCEMNLEMSTFKWNTVSSVYKDVMGTFNPRFMRP